MDEYKAIELLNYIKTFDGCDYGATKIAIDKGIEALEKQIPKKLLDTDKYDYKCPCCHTFVASKDDVWVYDIQPKYCGECGQKLLLER